MIKKGLGYGLTNLFSNNGSKDIEDYRIKYFQLGTGTIPIAGDPEDVLILSDNLDTVDEYGIDTNYLIEELNQIDSSSGSFSAQLLGHLKDGVVEAPKDGFTKIRLVLDKKIANDLDITEVAFFMKNPDGSLYKDKPVMILAEMFTAFPKASDLDFIFNWIVYSDDQ